MSVRSERDGPVTTVILDRPEARNAVDRRHAEALADAFRDFEADEAALVAVLWGAGGTFCAGADLKALDNRTEPDGDAPMGPTRMLLSKPVLAAVAGHAVAGGLELALWCDLRIAGRSSYFGIYNRRFGVPLIDLGTVRLPRLIGQSHALDLILTGRGVQGDEALRMGLVNRLTETGQARAGARELARTLAALPQTCMRSDRLSCYEQWPLAADEAMRNEFRRGMAVLRSGETAAGAQRFASGEGRHGR